MIRMYCPHCKKYFDYTVSMLLDNINETKGIFNRFVGWNTINTIRKKGCHIECPKCNREFKYEGEANELLN